MERGMRGRKEDDSGWRDVEDGPDEEKTHPRSISRILPQGLPRRLLLWVDDWDELGLSVLQLMVHSPTFRLIVFLYLYRSVLLCSYFGNEGGLFVATQVIGVLRTIPPNGNGS